MTFLANIQMGSLYKCGNFDLAFSGTLPYLVHAAVVAIKIVIPILLIIFGMLDLGKAVAASKEEEIKKGQQMFLKRAISAIIVFFVIQIVQILVRFVSNSDTDVVNCLNCFINGSVSDSGCVVTDGVL